ncbi:MAG TPA: acylneuraminate cytidylyltransferase [Spirochaetia bacterium]|nr:acylneuraminate cytidylyltransferase [Spirochaetia bacterium]
MRTGIFIQVRLGSTRLPRKATLRLPGGNIIQHVMRALARVPADVRALLTDKASAEELLPFAKDEDYALFAGPELDVLARYCMACREYGIGRVVRATGDNPLTSASLAARILGEHAERGADLSHYLGCPLGTGVEVVEAEALFAAERDAAASEEREHVTTFLYRHPERFSIFEPVAPASATLADAHVSVDTREDFDRITSIFKALYVGRPLEAEEVVQWLLRQDRGVTA